MEGNDVVIKEENDKELVLAMEGNDGVIKEDNDLPTKLEEKIVKQKYHTKKTKKEKKQIIINITM